MGCRSRKRREREVSLEKKWSLVLCRCSATWRGCDRSGRSDGGVKCGLASGVCGGGKRGVVFPKRVSLRVSCHRHE